MLLSAQNNIQAGANPATVTLGIKDQVTKEALSFLLIKHDTDNTKLIQPSRAIPKAFESWDIWDMLGITSASGKTVSLPIECFESSNLKISGTFLSTTEGSAKILVTGTTVGGQSIPIELLTLTASGDSFAVGTGVMGPPAPGGAVEIMGYIVKPQTINISGLFSVQLSVLVSVGTLNIQIGVS